MAMSAAQKEFEESLRGVNVHINKQTFDVSSATVIYETIDTPGVSIAGKIACVIQAIEVYPDFQDALNANLGRYKSQIAAGTQTAYVDIDNNKFIAQKELYGPVGAAGSQGLTAFPMVMVPISKPFIIVDPKMTILHSAANIPDLASDNVFTVFSYVNVELSLEVHQSILNSQMNLT